jgi:hypothetical protein
VPFIVSVGPGSSTTFARPFRPDTFVNSKRGVTGSVESNVPPRSCSRRSVIEPVICGTLLDSETRTSYVDVAPPGNDTVIGLVLTRLSDTISIGIVLALPHPPSGAIAVRFTIVSAPLGTPVLCMYPPANWTMPEYAPELLPKKFCGIGLTTVQSLYVVPPPSVCQKSEPGNTGEPL